MTFCITICKSECLVRMKTYNINGIEGKGTTHIQLDWTKVVETFRAIKRSELALSLPSAGSNTGSHPTCNTSARGGAAFGNNAKIMVGRTPPKPLLVNDDGFGDDDDDDDGPMYNASSSPSPYSSTSVEMSVLMAVLDQYFPLKPRATTGSLQVRERRGYKHTRLRELIHPERLTFIITCINHPPTAGEGCGP